MVRWRRRLFSIDDLPSGITIVVLRVQGQIEGIELMFLLAELAGLMKHVHWFQCSDNAIPFVGDASPQIVFFHDLERKQHISKSTDDMVRDVFHFIRAYTPYIEVKEQVHIPVLLTLVFIRLRSWCGCSRIPSTWCISTQRHSGAQCR